MDMEFGAALLIKCDRIMVASEGVIEFLPGIFRTDLHVFHAFTGICCQYGQSGVFMFIIAGTGESYYAGIIEIILLRSIGIVTTD